MAAPALIPVDLERCQTEIRTPKPFRMGGPMVEVTRCDGRAKWIATETKPGSDGQTGAMSVCAECRDKLEHQVKMGVAPACVFTAVPVLCPKCGSSRTEGAGFGIRDCNACGKSFDYDVPRRA